MTLRHRAVRSAAWTVPASVASRAVGLLGTLLLARYVAPMEYGAVMAAAIVTITAGSATTFGVGTYLVSNARVSRAEVFHASCWFLATGLAALGVIFVLGGPLERWSGAPGLTAFLPVLILAAAIERILYVPERILLRELRFGRLSLARASGELTFTSVSVALAAYDSGAMAIAWGSVARSAVRFALMVPVVDRREWLEPHALRLATFVRLAGYGLNVSAASLLTFGLRRWDNLLISRYFGVGSMAAYNYAYNLADTPATAIGDQLGDIIAGSFPHLDQRRRGAALVHSCTMVAAVMFPLSIGLAAVAPTVVETFFDTRWAGVGTMLMWLSAMSMARPFASILTSYFYASGSPRVVLWIEAGSLIGLVAALSTVGRLGVNWACASVGFVFLLRSLAGMWIAGRRDGIRIADFLLPMAAPLAASVVMAAGVASARPALADLLPAQRLLVEIGSGAALYFASLLAIAPARCAELYRVIRSALDRRGAAEPPATPRPSRAGQRTNPAVLSLSTEFPNPSEPAKGLFVRARLAAIRSRTDLFVVAPVASLDYANPHGDLLASRRIPRRRNDAHLGVLHPRWLYPPKGGWTNALFLCARLLPLMLTLRRRRPFDLIDAHFAHPEGIAAVLLGRILRRPVLVTLRGSELRYQKQRLKRFWMSWALRNADRVIAVSDGLRELALDLGTDAERVTTVPNGIDADVFFRRDRLRCRSSRGITATDRVVLAAGDLAELKGHHRTIAAVQALNESGLSTRLLIAGGVGRSGRYAETLRQQVTSAGLDERVAFLGEVTQESLAELMSAVDVFCLASSTEGWPNVVNEALACGTPVVATDVGAVRRMVIDDRYGYVVPVADGEALALALRTALTRDWDHDVISAHGRSRSWAHVADEVLEQMRAVMIESSPRAALLAQAARGRDEQPAIQPFDSIPAGTERP